MSVAKRIWLGTALVTLGSLLTLVSLWMMPVWLALLLAGAGALGWSYRVLTVREESPVSAAQPAGPAQASTLPEAPVRAAPEPAPEAAPLPAAALPAPPPGPPQPVVMNVTSFQDGRYSGRKEIPVNFSVRR